MDQPSRPNETTTRNESTRRCRHGPGAHGPSANRRRHQAAAEHYSDTCRRSRLQCESSLLGLTGSVTSCHCHCPPLHMSHLTILCSAPLSSKNRMSVVLVLRLTLQTSIRWREMAADSPRCTTALAAALRAPPC